MPDVREDAVPSVEEGPIESSIAAFIVDATRDGDVAVERGDGDTAANLETAENGYIVVEAWPLITL